MAVHNRSFDTIPRGEAAPVVQLVNADAETLQARGFVVEELDDTDVGPVGIAAVDEVGSTGLLVRYAKSPQPGWTLSFFDPIPDQARVRSWLIRSFGEMPLRLIWLYGDKEFHEDLAALDASSLREAAAFTELSAQFMDSFDALPAKEENFFASASA